MQKSERINLRVTPDEKKAWEEASGGKISEWLRELANWSIENQKIDGTLLLNNAILAVQTPKMPAQSRTSKCSRALYHQKDVYCKACGS